MKKVITSNDNYIGVDECIGKVVNTDAHGRVSAAELLRVGADVNIVDAEESDFIFPDCALAPYPGEGYSIYKLHSTGFYYGLSSCVGLGVLSKDGVYVSAGELLRVGADDCVDFNENPFPFLPNWLSFIAEVCDEEI